MVNEDNELEKAIASHPSIIARKVIASHIELYRQASITDELTGLLNKRGFEQRLEEAVKTAERYKIGFSLAYADLHRLKLYNDNYGNHYGNRAIMQFADIIRNNSREIDLLSRFGGDEFGLILPGTKTSAHQEYLMRMKVAVAQAPRVVENISFLAYWGIAEYSGQGMNVLKEEADKKLREEKKIINNILKEATV